MKIAIDCRMSGKSGIGTFLDGILPYFKSSGHELFLFGTEEGFPCNVKTFSVRELFFFPGRLLKKINECDVYFTPYCNIPGGIKIPVFSTIHDIVFLDVKGLCGKAGIIGRKFFYRRAVKKSAGIFTVSNFSRERIKSALKCTKKITVVYNGLPAYMEGKRLSVKKDSTIIFIGNIKRHKGLSVLLEAFEKFLESENGSEKPRLLITGSQDNFRTKDSVVPQKIKELSMKFPNSVEFTGFVENEKLLLLLSRARLLVQPSLYEGFGIPPLQALSCGTKAIISDIPVFREIYRDFPVVFFRSEDSSDLCAKIKEAFYDKSQIGEIPQKYSYKKTAELILENL
ncbi:glycosyltransferase family 4 protein [Treponema sp.]|uniref:glycosyltransferase family 4 protein n=1 Tax=Treponema sp. TaxID=166 RepID=UPI003F0DF35A